MNLYTWKAAAVLVCCILEGYGLCLGRRPAPVETVELTQRGPK